MKRKFILLNLILFSISFLSACGQTGKLYLPKTSVVSTNARVC
ncbi:MAG: lipoprotein [Gammaproteobacteria bacterium]|nr:lipoprotein [Gammaproteobacteria bacterium]